MNYNFKTKELAWKHLINKEIGEYKRFIKDDNLPSFNMIFSHNTNEKPNYSMKVDMYKRPSNLYINSAFMIDKNFNYRSTLFHEFTHLWDSENLLLDKDPKVKSSSLCFFTEFHASHIQSLYIMGCNSIDNYENANLNNLFNTTNSNIKLIEEYQHKYNSTKLIEDYFGLINSYMYYFGNITAKNAISNGNEDIQHFENIFDETLHLYYTALKYNIIDDRILDASYGTTELLEALLRHDGGR
ncbi:MULTISPECIES: hypothetical protein [unclassified Lacrimispora]|uniref:hypothetical protein n=1 Tax=unclassified Lacrimispora TaxID=2719232 RepID=UPI00376F65CD